MASGTAASVEQFPETSSDVFAVTFAAADTIGTSLSIIVILKVARVALFVPSVAFNSTKVSPLLKVSTPLPVPSAIPLALKEVAPMVL